MRQGQQNRRGRNRNHHHNRKGQNPLSRSYESNGPDVKIRGTAAHIAEKYISLARDASSSGDSVMAENYLQHAEHYNRIIMAYREQMQGADGMNGNRMRPSSPDDQGFNDEGGPDEEGVDDGMEGGPQSRFAAPRHTGEPMSRGEMSAEQPNVQPRPEEFGRLPQERVAERAPDMQPRFQHDREPRRDRERGDFPPRYREPREYRGEHRDRERGGEGRDRDRDRDRDRPQVPAPVRAAAPDVAPAAPPLGAAPQREPRESPGRQEGSRRGQRFQPSLQDQPEFLRRPVRRSRRDATEPGEGGEGGDNGTPRGEGQDKTTA